MAELGALEAMAGCSCGLGLGPLGPATTAGAVGKHMTHTTQDWQNPITIFQKTQDESFIDDNISYLQYFKTIKKF